MSDCTAEVKRERWPQKLTMLKNSRQAKNFDRDPFLSIMTLQMSPTFPSLAYTRNEIQQSNTLSMCIAKRRMHEEFVACRWQSLSVIPDSALWETSWRQNLDLPLCAKYSAVLPIVLKLKHRKTMLCRS